MAKIKRYDAYIAKARRDHADAKAAVEQIDLRLRDLDIELKDLLEQRSDAAAVQALSAEIINNAHKIIEGAKNDDA